MAIQIAPNDPALHASVDAKTEEVRKLLRRIVENYAPAALASSFSAEDMLLTDIVLTENIPVEIFSLDTGRLPQETYDLIARTRAHYGAEGQKIRLYFPRHELLEPYTLKHGINAFYESAELRKSCCFIRKIEPLRRALSGKKAWITGLRAEQSTERQLLRIEAYDEDNGLWKFNPLLDWTGKEIWGYIKDKNIPYNALHDRFYPSIGCAPCTRSVTVGEDPRSGRWWWERTESRECGLHVKNA
ncbi:MAG: phosphoadenylyl-sulfate reductase [Candidatus Accumulibacter sp.]|nr:phosphoadenylyl-sulfate reductase [Accumulibacter sp.]